MGQLFDVTYESDVESTNKKKTYVTLIRIFILRMKIQHNTVLEINRNKFSENSLVQTVLFELYFHNNTIVPFDSSVSNIENNGSFLPINFTLLYRKSV